MGFEEVMDAIARGVEVIGILTLVLSFSLEVEIDGRWPWRCAAAGRAGLSTTSPDTSEPRGA
jgi:hypothetical protein